MLRGGIGKKYVYLVQHGRYCTNPEGADMLSPIGMQHGVCESGCNSDESSL